jgi:hypothetical protein
MLLKGKKDYLLHLIISVVTFNIPRVTENNDVDDGNNELKVNYFPFLMLLPPRTKNLELPLPLKKVPYYLLDRSLGSLLAKVKF